MSAASPAPLDVLRSRLSAPTNTTSPTLSPTSSKLMTDSLALPTPPPETALPALRATIFLPTPVHPSALAYARERFGRVITSGEMDIAQALALADGIINRANPLPRGALDFAPKLVGIGVVGVGVDSIDLAACKEKRICVMNCPGANAPAVAELTLSLTLCLLRRVSELNTRLRRAEPVLAIDFLGRTLFGKVVGLVGMGSTARKAAELFHHAFGCEIHVFSPTSPSTRWTAHDPSGPLPHTRHSSLGSMLPLLDVLSLHCPLTPDTRGLIASPELAAMKPGSVLVNMSRGAVVDEAALSHTLRGGETVVAAASDVFRVEPVRRDCVDGLLDLDNFIGTPHIGGSTVEAQVDVCIQAIDQLADFFDGYPMRNRVC